MIFYCFGLILNLFEEIEFFKNTNVNVLFPLIMTSIIIPGIIVNFYHLLFLFLVMFMMKIRNNKDLLMLKTFDILI